MIKLGRILIFGIIAITFSVMQFSISPPNEIFACTCVAGISQEESFDKAKAVFTGKVLSIDASWLGEIFGSYPHHKVNVQVLESWKGIGSHTVTVATGSGDGDCGFSFQVGEKYLIYAYDAPEYYKTELRTGICERTRLLATTGEDLANFGKGTVLSEENKPLPPEENLFLEIIGELIQKIINPITFTIFNAPWHIALLIFIAYITPSILLLYFLIKRFIKK